MATPAAQINQQLLAQGLGQDVDAALIAQGISAGQPQPLTRRAPTMFDQVGTGLFSTGVADPSAAIRVQEQLGGIFGEGVLGRKGQRVRAAAAQDQFEVAKAGFFDQVAAAEIDLNAQDRARIDTALQGPGGFAAAQQIVNQKRAEQLFNLPEAVAARQRAVEAAGVTARTQEAQAQTAEAAAARAPLERRRLAAQTTTAEAAAARAPLETLQVVEDITRQQRAELITNRRDFINDVESNPALASGSKSLLAANQLDEILTGDFTSLDLAESAVLFTQTVEPGLAVREDDRIAFTRAAQAGVRTLRDTVNQFSTGRIDAEQARVNIRESLNSIMKPRAQSMASSLAFWQGVGQQTRGVVEGDVIGALGLGPRQLELIQVFASDEGSQPAIRQIQTGPQRAGE